jgi:hypothetical protein
MNVRSILQSCDRVELESQALFNLTAHTISNKIIQKYFIPVDTEIREAVLIL